MVEQGNQPDPDREKKRRDGRFRAATAAALETARLVTRAFFGKDIDEVRSDLVYSEEFKKIAETLQPPNTREKSARN